MGAKPANLGPLHQPGRRPNKGQPVNLLHFARNAGRQARLDAQPLSVCDQPTPGMRVAWAAGWRGAGRELNPDTPPSANGDGAPGQAEAGAAISRKKKRTKGLTITGPSEEEIRAEQEASARRAEFQIWFKKLLNSWPLEASACRAVFALDYALFGEWAMAAHTRGLMAALGGHLWPTCPESADFFIHCWCEGWLEAASGMAGHTINQAKVRRSAGALERLLRSNSAETITDALRGRGPALEGVVQGERKSKEVEANRAYACGERNPKPAQTREDSTGEQYHFTDIEPDIAFLRDQQLERSLELRSRRGRG